MSKFFVANLASAFVLIAAGAAFAGVDPTPAPQTPAGATAPAAQSTAASSAQSPTTKQPAAKVAKAKSPDDIICKPDTGTGSRVGGAKICLTRAQWKEHEND